MTASESERLVDLIRFELHTINPEVPRTLPTDELLRDELGVDSLDLVELVACLEYRFGVLVPEDDWVELRTINQIAEYMASHAQVGT